MTAKVLDLQFTEDGSLFLDNQSYLQETYQPNKGRQSVASVVGRFCVVYAESRMSVVDYDNRGTDG